jgi:putative ABC transport system permease protein
MSEIKPQRHKEHKEFFVSLWLKRGGVMESFGKDLRYGFRMLFKKPGFTAVAVLALALGIGANSAIFSVVNAVLLRPLGYKDPDRLVAINHNYPKLNLKASVSAFGFKTYTEQNHVFENLAAFGGWNVNFTGVDEPERLRGLLVSSSFFPTLGVGTTMGRSFLPEENQEGRERVVVLSDGLWRRKFGSDPAILGKTLTLNDQTFTVVGIMPADFRFGRETGNEFELYAPITFTPQQLSSDALTYEFLSVFARLKPGVTIQQAQADMDTIAANLREQYMPGRDASGWGLTLQPVHELLVGDVRRALLVLLGAVGFVLLIACANVANLLLARASTRQKEIAIRTALGAGRFRLIRQLLTESMLLALIGGILGLLIAFWGVDLLTSLNKANLPRAEEIGLDLRVLGFTFGISLLTGIIFGLFPAIQVSKSDLHDSLKEGGRTSGGSARGRIRSFLVVSEVAIALLLLIGAGLLIKSFVGLQKVNPGFQPEGLLSMQISLSSNKYKEPEQINSFYQETLQKIMALPGVQSAAACSSLPLSGANMSGSFVIEGRTISQGEMGPHGDRWVATAGYYKTMGIPLMKGRYFTEGDNKDSKPVVIIDESLARRYWPDEDPVGKRITFEGGRDNPIWREIVGIVGHVKHRSLDGESRVQYYIPQAQRPAGSMFIVVRGTGDPANYSSAVRGAIREVDKDQPVFRVRTMEQMVSDSLAQKRFSTLLLSIFAFVALLLSAVGLYGVISYSVSQRTHEIGIRMALGAQQRDVLKLVVRQGMILALVGVTIGIAAAFALTRVMSTLLFGVSATDPATFIIIPLLLAGVALLASYIPARKATKVDPMVALRYE